MRNTKIGIFFETSGTMKSRLEDVAKYTNINQGDLINRAVEQYLDSDKIIVQAEEQLAEQKDFIDSIKSTRLGNSENVTFFNKDYQELSKK